MERQPGFWALQGVKRKASGLLDPGSFYQSNEGMVLKVWACPACKLVRLYADDQGE